MKWFLCLLAVVSVTVSFGQNLVPNPSFEDTFICYPSGFPFVCATDWEKVQETPDFFYPGNPAIAFGVPENTFGYRYAASGLGYAGFWNYSTAIAIGINVHEKIGAQLSQPLTVGATYYVSFKLNPSHSFIQGSNGGTNKTGALFSTVQFSLSNPPPTNNFCHVWTDSILSDTTEWYLVRGNFLADSAYNYVYLGNFFDEAHTDTVVFWNGAQAYNFNSYQYVDDVCVSTDSLECALHTSTNHQPVQSTFSIYPNPSHQAVNLTLPQGSTQLEILSAIGQSVYKNNVASLQQTIDISSFPVGVYFARVHTHQGVQTAKFVVQR